MSLRLALARIGFRWRLAAALVCLLLAAVSAVKSRAVPDSSSRRTVVAVRSLAAGHRLSSGDLTVVRLPSAWPGAIASGTRLAGRTLAGPVARGEPVTDLRLIDRGLTNGLDPDLVALPIDVASDVRGLVRPGTPVDLLAVTEGGGGRSVARRVLVLAVLPAADSNPGCRLVLAVARDAAPRIAAAGASETFRVAALPP